MVTLDIKAELRQAAVFQSLDEADLEWMVQQGKQEEIAAGTAFITMDDIGERVFFILAGRAEVHLVLAGETEVYTVATLKRGETVGELTLLDNWRRSATAVAKDNLSIVSWGKTELLQRFEENLRMGYKVMGNLARLVAQRLVATNMELRNALRQGGELFR